MLMAVLSSVIDMKKTNMALFAGDDSLILSRERPSDEIAHKLSVWYNLESKLMKYNYFYFCYKFLISREDDWYMIPDILKLVSKLGREDLTNKAHQEEYRISLLDLLILLYDARNNDMISKAFFERYPQSYCDLTPVIAAIVSVVKNKEIFNSLFYSEVGDTLCEDPSRASLE